jgi:Tol biopolymer transport system component
VSPAQNGWLLYVQDGNLMAQRFERTTKTVSGEPVLVADSPLATGANIAAYGPAAFSASPSGLVAYRTGGGAPTQLTWFDRSGREIGILGARDEMGLYNPELSADGSQVAARRTVENNTDIWIIDGARTVRRTFDAALEQYPVWSPDGSWLAFSSTRKGVGDLYRKRTSGGGSEEPLWESPRQKNVDDWSPDGRFLLFNEEDPISLRDMWVLPLNGDRKPFVFLKTNSQEHRGQFSPDGRFVAYVSNEPGPHEIFVRPFPMSDEQWQISAGGGIQPRWSHDGKELFYIAPDGTLMATAISVKGGAIEPGTPRALFQTRIPGGGTNAYTRPQYDVSSDGRFLVNTTFEDSVTSPITLLLNWKP